MVEFFVVEVRGFIIPNHFACLLRKQIDNGLHKRATAWEDINCLE